MNGWIFPYRPWTGKTETVSTNLRLVVVPSFGLVSPRGVGSVAAVGQRRGDTEWEPAAEVVEQYKFITNRSFIKSAQSYSFPGIIRSFHHINRNDTILLR